MCDVEEPRCPSRHSSLVHEEYFGSGIMDLYIADSLQDMLDFDIKSEMATDLGCGTDFSDNLGVMFSELPENTELLDIEMDSSTTWITNNNSSLHSSSNFVHNLDLYGSEANAVMVNPNSVMPSMFSDSPIKRDNKFESEVPKVSPPSSPKKEEKNTLNIIKLKKLSQDEEDVLEKKETVAEEIPKEMPSKFIIMKTESIDGIKKNIITELDEKKIKFATATTTPTIKLKTSQPEILKVSKACSILNTNQKITGTQYVTAQTLGTKTIISGNIHILGHQQSRTLLANASKNPATILIDNSSLNNRQIIKTTMSPSNLSDSNTMNGKFTNGNNNNKTFGAGEFPKPAYSYSCLIAMALKNSRTGSLPVSEIYNFMCQHFPYFKTAPNGWKNSVRHNLSLNKCFEKIEKPSTNGGQRKGCLWAMNPTKVGKMDEEVQKWSRKDPQAIRKAMVCPDSLEALERGEMKYSTEGGGEGEDECSEEDDLDVDETYLLSASPNGSPILSQYEEDTSDVEVMDGNYEEIDIEESKPLKLEFAVASPLHIQDHSAKRPKTSFIYQAVSATPVHTNRRKTPLVNRIA